MNIYPVIIISVLLILTIIILISIKLFNNKPQSGIALIRYGLGGFKVSFSKNILVIPYIQKVEEIDLKIKEIKIQFDENYSLKSKDEKSIIIRLVFYVKINPTKEDVIKVATTIGSTATFDNDKINSLFHPKFNEAVKFIGQNCDSSEIFDSQDKFKHEIFNYVGQDLDGYTLSDIVIADLKIKN